MGNNTAFTPLAGDDYESLSKWLKDNAETKGLLDKALSNQTYRSKLSDKIEYMERDSRYYAQIQAYAEQSKKQQAQINEARAIALAKETDPLRRAELSIADGEGLAKWFDARGAAEKAFVESPTYKAIKYAESPQAGYEAGRETIENLKARTGKLLGDEDYFMDNIVGSLLNAFASVPLKSVTVPFQTLIGDHYAASYIYGLLDAHREVYGGSDEEGVVKAIQNKDFGQALERSAIKLAEIAPVIVMSIASPRLAGGVSGVSSGFEKYNQLLRSSPDAPEQSRVISSATTGVINAALISLSSNYILKSTLGKSALLEKSIVKNLIAKQVAEVTAWSIPIAMGKGAAIMTTKSLIGVSSDYLTDVALGLREYDEVEFRNMLLDAAVESAVTGATVSGVFATYGYLKTSALKKAAARVADLEGKIITDIDKDGKTVYYYKDLKFGTKAEADEFVKSVDETKVAVVRAQGGANKEAIETARGVIAKIKAKYPEASRPEHMNKLIILNARLIDELTDIMRSAETPTKTGGQDIVPAGAIPAPPVEPTPMPVPPSGTSAPPSDPTDIDPAAESEILKVIEGRKGSATPTPTPTPAPTPAPAPTPQKQEAPPVPDKKPAPAPLSPELEKKTLRALYALSSSAIPSDIPPEDKEALKSEIKSAIVAHITNGAKTSYTDLSPEEKALVHQAFSKADGESPGKINIKEISPELSKVIQDAIKTFRAKIVPETPNPIPPAAPTPTPETKPIPPKPDAPSAPEPKPTPKKEQQYKAVVETVKKLTAGVKKTVPIKQIQKELGLSRSEMIELLDDVYAGKFDEEIEFNSVRNPGNRYLKPDSDESKDRGWKFAGSLSLVSDGKDKATADGDLEYTKAEIADTRKKLTSAKRKLSYYENKLKLLSAKITDMELDGKDVTEYEATYAKIESIIGDLKNGIVEFEDELGRLEDIKKDLTPQKAKAKPKIKDETPRPKLRPQKSLSLPSPEDFDKWKAAVSKLSNEERLGLMQTLKENIQSLDDSGEHVPTSVRDAYIWLQSHLNKEGSVWIKDKHTTATDNQLFTKINEKYLPAYYDGHIKKSMLRLFHYVGETKNKYGWREHIHELEVHSPLDENIGETIYEFVHTKKKAYYDKRIIDKDGKIIDDRYVPLRDHPVLNSSEKSETKMWRGISAAELSSIIENGEVKSFGDMNFENQKNKTSASDHPSQPLSYATSFAAWYDQPSFQRPGYIIEMNRTKNSSYNAVHEIEIDGSVPIGEITKVYELRIATEVPSKLEATVDDYSKKVLFSGTTSSFKEYVVRELPESEWKSRVGVDYHEGTRPSPQSLEPYKFKGVVQDSNGKALTLYHGGTATTSIDPSMHRNGIIFFTPDKEVSEFYGRNGSVLQGKLIYSRMLDLTNPYDQSLRQFINSYSDLFDEWIDRSSGELTSVYDLLETGTLHDYEGTGSGNRWYDLFVHAKDMGYDLVKVNDITINTTAPSYVVFSPQNIILDKGESIGADISPYTNKPLTHEELETARRVIENKLSAIPKGLYEITTQRGMYKNYDTNEVDVEPSFHVTLNTTDPKYTNAFVMALNEFAQEHGQQSFILTKYIDDSDMNVFSSTGENGGQVTPGIYIKFSSPLNEEQKMIVAKLAIEKGLVGLSISDDGSHATAYDAGDLYGTDPQDFVEAAAAFSEAIKDDGGSEGIKGTVESYAQETWAYTADPRRSGAGSYQQLDRYHETLKEGETVLGFKNPNTRIIDTEGLKGKELSVARVNNAMASAGMDQNTIDATTGVMVDIVERLASSFAPGLVSDEMFEQFFSCIQYVDESITDSTVAEILENLSSGSVPDTVFQEKLDDRFDTLLDKSKSSEDVSGSADVRKLIITKRNDVVGQGLPKMIVYEVIQNSVDAGAKNIEFYRLTGDPKIELSEFALLANLDLGKGLGENLEHYIITDDGSGMSPEDVRTKLLRIGNTGKGDDKSGAYGIAKTGFILGSEMFQVVTIKDGIKTELTTNFEMYMDSMEPGGKPMKLNTEPTNLPNGTLLNLVIKENGWQRLGSQLVEFAGRYSGQAKISFIGSQTLSRLPGAKPGRSTLATAKALKKNLVEQTTHKYNGNEFVIQAYENDLGDSERESYPEYIVTTHGVPVYARPGIWGVKWFGKGKITVFIDFTKLNPDPESNNYPFINNRTQLSDDFNSELTDVIRKLIAKAKNDNIDKAVKEMIGSIKNGIKIDSNTMFVLPGNDEALRPEIEKHIETHKKVYAAFGRVIQLFNKYIAPSFPEPIKVGIGYGKGVNGWRPNEKYQEEIKKDTGKEFFAVNLFNCLENIYNNTITSRTAMIMKDAKTLLARQLVMVMCHEACHKYGSDDSAEFSYALCDLQVSVGYEMLANFQDEVYYELFEARESVSINELTEAGGEVERIFSLAGSRGGINQNTRVLGSSNDGGFGSKEEQDVNRGAREGSLSHPDRGIQRNYSRAEDSRIIRGLAFSVDKTGRFYIALGKDMDATTGIHELAHAYEKALALAATRDPKMASLYNRLSMWLGATPHKWNTAQRERFVSGFMTTLYNGVNRGGVIGEVYSKMQKIISGVWDKMSNNPAIELDPEVKAIYDVIFGAESDAKIFNQDDLLRAKKDNRLIIPNGTRGSPLIQVFTTPSSSYITQRINQDTHMVVFRGDGTQKPVSFYVFDHGDFITVDGMNCHNHAQIAARVAQIVNAGQPVDLKSYVFHADSPAAEKVLKAAEEEYAEFAKNTQKHLIQLINSLKGRFDVAKFRVSLMNVISDTIVMKFGVDPMNAKSGASDYAKWVKEISGRSKLHHCTTLELVKTLEKIDPGSTKAFFNSTFFDVVPKLVKRLQHEFNDYSESGEEDMFKMVGNLMKGYSSGVVTSSQTKLNTFRIANVLIAKLGREGREVLSRTSAGKNWSERMAGHGAEIIYEMKELFMNHRNSNKLGERYYLEHQKLTGAIVKAAIEHDFEAEVRGISQDDMPDQKLPPLTEEQHAMVDELRNAYIRNAVQQSNRAVKEGKSTGRIVHPDDVIKFKDLMLEINGYYETQILELNKLMGRSVIGLRKNYIMNVLEGIASDQPAGIVKEGRGDGSIGDLLGSPPWIKTYTGAEGEENTDYIPILNAYNASMSKYIAFYPTIHYVNNELPLDVSQTFNTGYEEVLHNYLKGIMGYAPPRRSVDKFISLARTNVTSTALSWSPAMIALNFIQRHLSAVFVNPTVWAETNKLVNVFSGRLRNPDKHPLLADLLTILQTGGKSLYEEQIEKWRSLDIDKELSTALRAFRKVTKISEFNLQHSGFMATERGNWGFAYAAGALQAVMSSKQYVDALKQTKNKSQAIELALSDPKVFDRALVSGMIVNAATNCDPSPAFSPNFFTRNNLMANLLWFMRFGINHAQIMISDVNPMITNKNNWSQGLFRSIVYGDEEQAAEANRLMVMNIIVDMMSPANMSIVFQHEDKYNNRFSKADMKRAYATAKIMRDEFRKNLNKPQHGYFRLSGSGIVLNGLGAFFAYTIAEFLIQYWTRMLKSWQNKNIGAEMLPPEAAKRKAKKGEDNIVLNSALSTANLSRFVTSPTIASGLFPNINVYSVSSSKAWARAGVRYGVTQIAPLGVSTSIMEAITGVSVDEMIVEELYRVQK